MRAGFESRSGYRGATDVIPIRESVFRRKRNIVGTLAYAGAHEGVVVYERA